MNTKLILIIAFSILYGFFEIFMSRRQQDKREISKSGDKGSIWLLTISISIGYWLSFIIASTKIGRIYHWNTFFVIGSILALTGLIIRVTSILKLKQQFTYTVTKIENHELIETGLYKIHKAPRVSWTAHYFSGDFYLFIKLVINFTHDYSGFVWDISIV